MNMNKLTTTAILLASAAFLTNCSTAESDGRQYSFSSPSPIQGKMGVSFKRVPIPGAQVSTTESKPKTIESDGLLGALTRDTSNDSPGLLDFHSKPDEPGASYWMHGSQSPSPLEGKMGVRVSRRKK